MNPLDVGELLDRERADGSLLAMPYPFKVDGRTKRRAGMGRTSPDQQQAYDKIRNLLLDGIRLCPANYLLPFHCGGDASNDGKAFGIHQYSDLPPGTPLTVTAHFASETAVLLTATNTAHTIPHNDHNRRVIAWFSKTWSDADRKRAPFYLEADALLWGLSKCRFWPSR